MVQVAQQLLRNVDLHLAHAPTDRQTFFGVLGLANLDGEAMLQHLAAAGAHVEPHHVLAVPQAARWAVKRVTTAQRILPVGESDADILPRQTIMRVTQPLIVKQHLDAGDTGAGQRPAFDRQSPRHRLDGSAGHDHRCVDFQPELCRRHRRRWRWRTFDDKAADLFLHVIKAVPQHHANRCVCPKAVHRVP